MVVHDNQEGMIGGDENKVNCEGEADATVQLAVASRCPFDKSNLLWLFNPSYYQIQPKKGREELKSLASREALKKKGANCCSLQPCLFVPYFFEWDHPTFFYFTPLYVGATILESGEKEELGFPELEGRK